MNFESSNVFVEEDYEVLVEIQNYWSIGKLQNLNSHEPNIKEKNYPKAHVHKKKMRKKKKKIPKIYKIKVKLLFEWLNFTKII